MGIWSMLEIEPTNDQRKIKKAYVKQLKIYHPEDDPEGYQRLREAYESALIAAKEEDVPTTTNRTQTAQFASEILVTEVPIAVQTRDPVLAFMDEVDVLYEDFFARIDVNRWTEVLSADILWDIEKTEELQEWLIYYLEEKSFLPHSIWQLFDSVFHWGERKEEMVAQYGEEIHTFLVGKIEGISALSYDYFDKTAPVDFNRFVQVREQAQQALMADELDVAKIAIEEALQLYTADLSILHLQVNYNQRLGNDAEAVKVLDAILSINPEDEDAHVNRLAIYYNEGQYEQTITAGEQFLRMQPEQEEAKLFVIKSYAQLGDFETGTTLAKEIWSGKPYNPEFIFKRENHFSKNKTIAEKKARLKESPKKHRLLGLVMYTLFVFIRRMWVYIIPFFIIGLLTPIPFKYAALCLLPAVWEVWKIQKIFRL